SFQFGGMVARVLRRVGSRGSGGSFVLVLLSHPGEIARNDLSPTGSDRRRGYVLGLATLWGVEARGGGWLRGRRMAVDGHFPLDESNEGAVVTGVELVGHLDPDRVTPLEDRGPFVFKLLERAEAVRPPVLEVEVSLVAGSPESVADQVASVFALA